MGGLTGFKILGTMSKYTQISFQGYRQPVTNIKPKQLITLNDYLYFTAEPGGKTLDVFHEIALAEAAGNNKLKAELKQKHLWYTTPCVVIDPIRNYKSIKYFTGLLVLDFDHIDYAQEFKYFLFHEYKFIIAVWLSPSKRGVKCLVRIPIVQTVVEFKEYYYGIAAEMEQYNGFDSSGQNCVLPLFQSYDPDLLDRDDAETWTIRGIKRGDFTLAPVRPTHKIEVTDRDKQIILKIIDSGFSNIVDYGHPPLRSLCITLGGYVASGYIEEYEALQIVNNRIECHPYLSKGIYGYQRTAIWAIRIGQNKPLTLNYRHNGG